MHYCTSGFTIAIISIIQFSVAKFVHSIILKKYIINILFKRTEDISKN